MGRMIIPISQIHYIKSSIKVTEITTEKSWEWIRAHTVSNTLERCFIALFFTTDALRRLSEEFFLILATS